MLGAKVLARAKVNLFLEVGHTRDDGYHEIRSVMQALDLADELYFRRTEGQNGRMTIRCSDRNVPPGEENTVWKAVRAFAGQTGVMKDGGIEVFINKRIPVGAGLAGGSADAAAALLAMNHIWELELPGGDLAGLAEMVGSDVPFCLSGGTALVSGRGQVIERLEPLPAFQVVLAAPEEEYSTREVYRRFDSIVADKGFPGRGAGEALDLMVGGIRSHDFEAVCRSLHNSLEAAAFDIERVEKYKRAAIDCGARGALMTGSGPAVFALVEGMEEAAEVAWELGQVAPITIITSFSEKGAEIRT